MCWTLMNTSQGPHTQGDSQAEREMHAGDLKSSRLDLVSKDRSKGTPALVPPPVAFRTFHLERLYPYALYGFLSK
jgi:hypothetical protein